MFNVNPARMWRNKDKQKGRYHRIGRKSIFFFKPKPTRKPTHKASAKRRAKALRKARMWPEPEGIPLDELTKDWWEK